MMKKDIEIDYTCCMKNIFSLLLITTILFLSAGVYAGENPHNKAVKTELVEQSVLSFNKVGGEFKFDMIVFDNCFMESLPTALTHFSPITLNSKRLMDVIVLTGYSCRFY